MRFLPALLLLLLAAGCRVAAPRGPVTSPTPPQTFVPAQTDTLSAGTLPWRQFFRDSALVGLLDTAMRQNLDVRIAVQRVEVYQAQYLARREALFPTVSAGGTAGLDHFGKYTLTGVGNFDTNFSQNIEGSQRVPLTLTPNLFVGLRSSWEIDIWGKLRSRRRAAYLRVLASEQGRNLVITNLLADVARAYYELQALDSQLAALELRATHADVDAARAAFLPSLTLTPYLGLNSFSASQFFNPSSVVYGVLVGLTGPILNRAQVRADYRQAVAGSYQGYYRYQQALQAGFREVVVGLRGLENYRAADLRAREVAQLRSAVATANELFVAGYASYLEVITAQRSVLDAELSLADARQAQLLQSVNLYRALGGGWR